MSIIDRRDSELGSVRLGSRVRDLMNVSKSHHFYVDLSENVSRDPHHSSGHPKSVVLVKFRNPKSIE